MAERGGQPGNQNARKPRLFEDAFIREIKQRDLEIGDGQTLRKIAAKLIDMAIAGDVAAFRESRDTVDGKPTQALEHSGEMTVHGLAGIIGSISEGAKNDPPVA